MNELQQLLAASLAGIVLGAIFFGGLWWTVQHCVTSRWAALCFPVSLLLRTAIVMLGFYVVLGDDWRRLSAGLLGFVIARLLVTLLTRARSQRSALPQKASHAP